MQTFLRNITQQVLITLLNLTFRVRETKLFLYSKFMAKQPSHLCIKTGTISKCTFVLDTKDRAVARRIFIGLDDEYLKAKKALEWIHAITGKKCSKMCDVGANIGHVSLPLLLDGSLSRAVLCEPHPTNFRLLTCNVVLNGLQQKVELFNTAVAAKSMQLTMELSEDNFGDHRIKVSDADGLYDENQRKSISVHAEALDSLIGDLAQLPDCLIWIDVQGYEAEVLSGARAVIAVSPAVVFEFWPYGLCRAGGVEKLLRAVADYEHFYDLSDAIPQKYPVHSLEPLCNEYRFNDNFTKDILFIKK
jgi:FkbM family methyltransferase